MMKRECRFAWLAAFLLLTTSMSGLQFPGAASADTYFAQTDQTLWGPFEAYWQAHGGLSQFGLPRTTVFPTKDGYDAQWFERALFTYNVKKPDPYKVELQLLGDIATANRQDETPFKPAQPSGQGSFFKQTSHNLSGKILDFWTKTGGIPIYGYPISEAFQERSKSDGKAYLVQYFERNRLEYHPELAGTQFEVQLGLLGSEQLDAQGGPQSFANLGSPNAYPPPTGVSVPPGGIVTSPGAGGENGTPSPVPTPPPAPALPATNKPVLYSNDFSTPDLSGWQPSAGPQANGGQPARWQVRNGVLAQTGMFAEEGADESALLVLNGKSFGDFRLDVQAYYAGSEGIGALFRQSTRGFYWLRLYPQSTNADPKAELLKVTPNGVITIAQSSGWAGLSRRAWHLLTVTAQASSYTVQVDGANVLSDSDTSYTVGAVGLYTYADGTSLFDNFRVTQP